MKINNAPEVQQAERADETFDVSRRRFFQLAGGIAGAGLLLSSCRRTGPTDVYIGEGDRALLNFLYILEQLEAYFYTQAVSAQYYQMDKSELQLLTDIRDQEIAHREFFKAVLGKGAIPAISINFTSVTFADRNSVITNAVMLEDLVVSGINGALRLFNDTSYIPTIAKMTSVEARHSAYFRNLVSYGSFADATVIDSNGLDKAASPLEVLGTAETFIYTRFDSSKLPN